MTSNSSRASHSFPAMGQLFTLRNADGMRATISERGATLISWQAPDRYGRLADVVLGCSDARAYADNRVCFGAVNDNGWQLRGGPEGHWHAFATDSSVSLRLMPAAGEMNSGALQVIVHYRLGDDGSLAIEVEAQAPAPTPAPMHLTVHPYFNLNGGRADVGDHMLQIDADKYIEVDADGWPLRMARVGGTAFDFRRPAAIGARLTWPDPQVEAAGGFNHRYCVMRRQAGALREVARVVDPGSGRRLQVSTTGGGLQLYSGNALDGFCLEAHASERPDASRAMLQPGQVYRQATVYRMSLQEQEAHNRTPPGGMSRPQGGI